MLVSLLLSAHAATAASALPVWKWPAGEVQRFHIETEIVTPRGMRYLAANNIDARAGTVKVRADAACTARPVGKTQVVRCDFAYIEAKGLAWVEDEKDKLDKILAEWSGDLGKSTVEMEMSADGRLRSFDVIGGKERTNSREGYIIEQQRTLLQRVFAGFDLPLTTDEKDWVRGWSQKGSSALMQLQTIGGTAGAFDMKHTQKGTQDGLLLIETTAKATLSAGAAVDASSGSRLVDVRLAGETLFDADRGMMAWRDFTIDGRLMVSAQEAGNGAEYFQMGAIQWVDTFPEPGEVPLSIAATRAPKLPGKAPEAAVPVVAFADLGMQPLFVVGHPDAAKPLELPAVKVKARVVVGADGLPNTIQAFDGFQVLAAPTEEALRAARFPARGAPYAVDLELEWRPEPAAE
ncbi:MAG: hypothetical protein ACK4YP_11055 [Myxococcota bacterium]